MGPRQFHKDFIGREEYDKEKGKGTCNLADIPGKIGVEVSGTFHKKLGKVLQLRGHNEEKQGRARKKSR